MSAAPVCKKVTNAVARMARRIMVRAPRCVNHPGTQRPGKLARVDGKFGQPALRLLDAEFLALLPDRPVRLLVERRAAGGILAERVVLGAHQRGAVAEGAADPLAVESAVLLQLLDEIGLSQGRTTDADEGAPAVAQVRRRRGGE